MFISIQCIHNIHKAYFLVNQKVTKVRLMFKKYLSIVTLSAVSVFALAQTTNDESVKAEQLKSTMSSDKQVITHLIDTQASQASTTCTPLPECLLYPDVNDESVLNTQEN